MPYSSFGYTSNAQKNNNPYADPEAARLKQLELSVNPMDSINRRVSDEINYRRAMEGHSDASYLRAYELEQDLANRQMQNMIDMVGPRGAGMFPATSMPSLDLIRGGYSGDGYMGGGSSGGSSRSGGSSGGGRSSGGGGSSAPSFAESYSYSAPAFEFPSMPSFNYQAPQINMQTPNIPAMNYSFNAPQLPSPPPMQFPSMPAYPQMPAPPQLSRIPSGFQMPQMQMPQVNFGQYQRSLSDMLRALG